MSSNEEDGREDDDRSAASSYNSGDYKNVARSGFTRMYVLSHSSLSPLDKSNDYYSEYHPLDDEKDSEAKRHCDGDSDGDRRISPTQQSPRYQLLYASGRHYFHGTIELPEGIVGSESRGGSLTPHEEDNEDDDDNDILVVKKVSNNPHGLAIADLPILLPHFQEQQDVLAAVDKVTDFRSEVRDVLYHMEEVGAFMVEELSKDKTINRIEQASKELHWIVSPKNPTFFELQTFPGANDGLDEAGVVLIVMKIVVREVLLDVIYFQNSYFVTLRENNDELALEDTFIPNVACVGPCFVVRSYNDDDIKKLVLWCALPVSDMDDDLVIEGNAASVTLQLQPQLASVVSKQAKNAAKVKPMASSSRDTRAVLDANDTQLYCLLPLSAAPVKRRSTITKKTKQRKRTLSGVGDEENEDHEEDDEEDERRELVVFQFNEYVYHGDLWVCPSLLNDLAKLSTYVFPHLRMQSHSLAFFGKTEDLPSASYDVEDDSGSVDKMRQFAGIQHRFGEIASTLLTLMMDSQTWIQDFLTEVDAIVSTEDSTTSTSPISSEWLASHLKAWLEVDDDMEAFFELELGNNDPLAQSVFGDFDESQVDLMVWKGIVNAAIMVVVYRKGSFYMILRDQSSEGDATKIQDATELFGAIPPLGSKGRGYLIRKFPTEIQCKSQQWLTDGKLLLWQTSASLAREELREAQAKEKRRNSSNRQSQQTLCTDWFEADGLTAASEADAKASESKSVTSREAERTDEKSLDCLDAKEHRKPAKVPLSPPSAIAGDKVSRRHHIPPLSSAHSPMKAPATTTAPWDRKTGRPL